MGVRVLLGALAMGLVLFGSGGAHAGRSHVPTVAEAGPVLVESPQVATFSQDDEERGPLSGEDQGFGDSAQPDSEEVCTILMVLRGPACARPGVVRWHRALSPPLAAGPPVPPPEPPASISKFSAESDPAVLGATRSATAAPANLLIAPHRDLIRKCADSGSLPDKTSSAWDLDDDPGFVWLAGEKSEPDNEVCTVLMVWRGAKPATAEAPKLRKQAPFLSIVPPVPPPQGRTTASDFLFSGAPKAAGAAAGDAGLPASRSAEHLTSITFSNLFSSPQDPAWGRGRDLMACASRLRVAAREAVADQHEFKRADKIPSKGSIQWGTS